MTSPAPVVPADTLKSIFKEQPKEVPFSGIAPHLPRYLFNPFHDLELDSILARHSGIILIPAGIIFPVGNHSYKGTNYLAVGLSELLDASESLNQPSEKMFSRSAETIATSLAREFQGSGQSTGFCRIECLDGVEDQELIIDLQQFFFPKRCQTVHEQIERLTEAQADVAGMPQVFGDVLTKLIWSTEMSRIYCEERLETTKASIEERANGGFGKRQPSPYDKEICAWLGVEPPRALTKLDLGKGNAQQQAQPIIVQTAAASDGLERKQCLVCGELVALIDGELPAKCKSCGDDPRGPQTPKATNKPAAAKPKAKEAKEE